MTVAQAYARWSDGCSERCRPPVHDLLAHEQRGYERGYAVGYERGYAATLAKQAEQGYAAGYAAALAEQAERTVRTGNLVVELKARRIWVDGARVAVKGRAWGILAYLAEHVGRWCPNDEIVAAVWGREWLVSPPYGARAERAAPHVLNVNLCRLRARLGSASALISSGRVDSESGGGRRLEAVEPAPDPKGGPA